jgi:hypothetical protein
LSQETISLVNDACGDVPEVANSGPPSANALDRPCDAASLAKTTGRNIPEIVTSGSISKIAAASTALGTNNSTGMKGDNTPLTICQPNDVVTPVERGDYVKVLYEEADMFGDLRKEW